MLSTVLLSLVLNFSLTPPESVAQTNGSYRIVFEKIDNRVEVFIGDSLIYNSGIVRQNPKMELWVNIDDSLLEYSNQLTIKLINGAEGTPDGVDIHWEIKFYIYKGDELIEWDWNDADDGKAGVVFEETYTLE